MSERPILFSGLMVRAILEGRKTQTRRVVRVPRSCRRHHVTGFYGPEWWLGQHPVKGWWACYPSAPSLAMAADQTARGVEGFPCPYGQPGDTLWVRERALYWCGGAGGTSQVAYADDSELESLLADQREMAVHHAVRDAQGLERVAGNWKWRPSIHMPRWASRLMLRVEDVRVQRLQGISEEDALAEGVTWPSGEQERNIRKWGDPQTARMRFADLWDSINAKRGYSWESNCWVWAITFSRVERGA
jgi:hypothetical protein